MKKTFLILLVLLCVATMAVASVSAATLKTGKNVIKGRKVVFTVNGKKYTAKTNSKGIATVKVKLSKKKTYKVIARFAGDKYYKASKRTSKVVIK